MERFDLVDAEKLSRIVTELKPSTCSLDPIPTSLFKTIFNFVSEDILAIVNHSLQLGVFPTDLKTALVKPLLKKGNLDILTPSSFRPISNLPFLSKILEKLVFNQLTTFLNSNTKLEMFQSGFRRHHSTETALLKVVNDIRTNLDSKKPSVLVLLDLSAAFDTVDHQILLDRLSEHVGLSGIVFQWFTSYLCRRNFFVCMDGQSSKHYEVTCGVPQGSVLGPLLFNLYMLPLGSVIRRHGISFHSYADDTQLYVAVSPDDTGPIDSLFNCISDIKAWMSQNFLQLNQDKTEVMVIGSKTQREKLVSQLNTQGLKPSQEARNLGVIFDADFNFKAHVRSITKTAFFHLKNISKVRPFLSLSNTERLMHAFITSRLDYCNALLSGQPNNIINRLQLIQNSAARVLTKTKRRAHITSYFKVLTLVTCQFSY